jgi:hypothetical protein
MPGNAGLSSIRFWGSGATAGGGSVAAGLADLARFEEEGSTVSEEDAGDESRDLLGILVKM